MEEELTLRDLVEILRRKRAYVVGLPLLALILAGVYAFFVARPVYESRAVIAVNPVEIRARLEEKIELQPAINLTPEGLRLLLVTQEVLVEVARSLREDGTLPARWAERSDTEIAARFKGALKAEVGSDRRGGSRGSGLLTVSLTARAGSPELAAALAGAWARVAVNRLNEIPAIQIRANLEALNAQLPRAEAAFREARKAWEAFRRTDRRNLWENELAQVEERIATLAQRLRVLPTELAVVEAERRAVLERMRGLPERKRLVRSVVDDPVTAAAANAVGLAALKGLRLESEVLNPTRQELEQQSHRLYAARAKLLAERAALADELARQRSRAEELRENLAAAELEAERLQESLELAKKAYLALRQKQTDLSIELASLQNVYAAVVADAQPEPEPVAPRKALILALAGTMGLMLGVFAAFVSAALEPRPEGAEQTTT